MHVKPEALPKLAALFIILCSLSGYLAATKSVVFIEQQQNQQQQQQQEQQPLNQPVENYQYGAPKGQPATGCPYEQQMLQQTKPMVPIQHQQTFYEPQLTSNQQTSNQQTSEPDTEKWQIMDGQTGVKMDEIPLPPKKSIDDYSFGEPQMSDQDLAVEEKQQQYEPAYEMVNNRLWNGDVTSEHEMSKERNERHNNWWTWRKVISYFPSGQEQLKKQRLHLERNFHLKSGKTFSEQQVQDINSPLTKTTAAQDSTSDQQQPIAMDQPAIVMSKKGDESELDQQHQSHLREPDFGGEQLIVKTQEPAEISNAIQQPEFDMTQKGQLKRITVELEHVSPKVVGQQKMIDQVPPLTAADVGRQLKMKLAQQLMDKDGGGIIARSHNQTSALVDTDQGWESAPTRLASDLPDFTRQLWSGSKPGRESIASDSIASSANRTTEPLLVQAHGWSNSNFYGGAKMVKFLGRGQVQRIDGNGRSQARLSCQFGEEKQNLISRDSKVTISNVEWAKFVGDYDLNQQEPPFDCGQRALSCRLIPVLTDTVTTVHPRPLVQMFTNDNVPNYSVTLHEVDNRHLGIYRCSAQRESNGKRELVYRIIPFEFE